MAKISLFSSILGSQALKTTYVKTAGQLSPVGKGPDEVLDELFHEVRQKRLYGDGKTFVDLIPRHSLKQIRQQYRLERRDPNFDLREFVSRHFYAPEPTGTATYHTDPKATIEQHISALWDVLGRETYRDRGSLLALPYPYIVPGGRFREQFYWDSYFIMLGLAADDRWKTVEGMMKNYAYLMRKFGYIPTANRTYLLSRSQPPFFAGMVRLLASHKGRRALVEYLPYLLMEHRFWMKGRSKLAAEPYNAYARVVQLPDGSLLNRYYDNKTTPRPESLDEDTETAAHAPAPDEIFLHLRAGAESGWDFSSRWFLDPGDIRTIHTTDLVPVDLNCLLYELELTIADAYDVLQQSVLAGRFRRKAEHRAAAIRHYCWDDTQRFYGDFDIRLKRPSGTLTLAGVFPLYVGIATPAEATAVAKRLEKDFLKAGGLLTTLQSSGQQWDAPNGWAPLHYAAIKGLERYGHHELAVEIKRRWIDTNRRVFDTHRKLVEKYDVVRPGTLGGGGEYPLQDGFGWTNGVLTALLSLNES